MSASQIKQILVGCLFISLPVCVVLIFMGLSSISTGYAQELFSTITAFFCTPIIMESSLFLLGFITLFGYLAVKRHFEGDDFQEIEVEVDEK